MASRAGNASARFREVRGWQGVCTVEVIGEASNFNDDNGCDYVSAVNRTAMYSGVFAPFGLTPSNSNWKMTSGSFVASIDDKTYEIGHGCSTRSTVAGSESDSIANRVKAILSVDSIVLYLSSDSYSLVFPETRITADFTLYEPDAPEDIAQGPDCGRWSIPGGRLDDIPYPSAGLALHGVRIAEVTISPPRGDDVEMDTGGDRRPWSLMITSQ